jgi:quinol monooxygenase YgiN
MQMVVEYIRYSIPSERRREFESAYDHAGRPLAASSHCRAYEVTRCVEEPASYVVRIEWDSIEGHEGGFRTSAEFQEFFAAVRPFVGDIEEMRHYELVTPAAA